MRRSSFLKAILLSAPLAAVATTAQAAPVQVRKATTKMLGTYSHPTRHPSTPGSTFRGACVRFGPSGPYLHTNSMHQSVGVIPESLAINAQGDLTFELDESLPVISTYAVPDETMVTKHISAGISGGVKLCNVYVVLDTQGIGQRLDLNNPIHYAKVEGETSNLWIGVNSYSPGTGA